MGVTSGRNGYGELEWGEEELMNGDGLQDIHGEKSTGWRISRLGF